MSVVDVVKQRPEYRLVNLLHVRISVLQGL